MVNIENKINDKEYFAIKDRESYSSVSNYAESPKKYIQSKERSQDTSYFSLGKLVDFIRTEGEEKAREVYSVNILAPLPPQLEQYVNYIVENIESEKALTNDLKLEAVKNLNILKSSKKEDTILKTLSVTDDYLKFYYKNKDKIIISFEDWTTAISIINEWKNNEYTRTYTNMVTHKHIEVFDEFPILWEYNGIDLKSKLDRIIIDHKDKTIIPIDYKTSSKDVHNFIKSYWNYKYYYQASMYVAALKFIFPEYKILPFIFIVGSTVNNEVAVYEINSLDTRTAMNDFKLESGNVVKGWTNLLQEMKEQKELNYFEYTLNYIKNGFYQIKNFKQIK